MSKSLPPWAYAWHVGIAPLLPTEGLRSLQTALRRDDPKLLQGATTVPPPLQATDEWNVEKGDPIVWCFWMGGDEGDNAVEKTPLDILTTVGDCEEAFTRICYEVNRLLGEPAGCRHFLNWWDETPREEAFRLMLDEVSITLDMREDGYTV